MIDSRATSNVARHWQTGGRSEMSTVLVIDRDPEVAFAIRETLESRQLEVISAATPRDGIDLVRQRRPEAVILDVWSENQPWLETYEEIRRIDHCLPVIITAPLANSDWAIKAICHGAHESLIKPVDLQRLKQVVIKAVEVSLLSRALDSTATEAADEISVDRIIGRSLPMQELFKKIGRIAPQESAVLIQGESGTGKEQVARAIFDHNRRNQRPFQAIHCAALPETLLESELFGHERGAFKGARRARAGKVELAHGGTLFLDEIGGLSSATQGKILRLLEEQRFERLGGNTTLQADLRIIAATNQNLSTAVIEGRFRQDLLYRLNGFTIQLPPLRDCVEDISVLADHFVKMFNRELGKTVRPLAASVIRLLQQHCWPGNVRELQSTIRYAMVTATGDILTPECLPESCLPAHPTSMKPVDVQPVANQVIAEQSHDGNEFPLADLLDYIKGLLNDDTPQIYKMILQEVERHILHVVMNHVRGNQSEAAKRLGIARMTLRTKLELTR